MICKQSGDACLLEGANLGNVHFVINIFVLDLYGQHFGNICKLNIYVGIRCKLPIIWEYCNLNIYFGIGYILGGICQVGGFCALCVHRVGEFVYFVIHIFVLNITCQQLGNLCQFYSYMVSYIFCKQFRDAISCICVILYLHSLYLCIWDLGTSIWIYLKQDM